MMEDSRGGMRCKPSGAAETSQVVGSIDVVARECLLVLQREGANPQVLEAVLSMRPEYRVCDRLSRQYDVASFVQNFCQRTRTAPALLGENLAFQTLSALQTMNAFSRRPCSFLTAYSLKWAIEFFTRKLLGMSWEPLRNVRGILTSQKGKTLARVRGRAGAGECVACLGFGL